MPATIIAYAAVVPCDRARRILPPWRLAPLSPPGREILRISRSLSDQAALPNVPLWSPIGSYAYGWDVGSGPAGQRLVGKAGGQPGAKSYLRVWNHGSEYSAYGSRTKPG